MFFKPDVNLVARMLIHQHGEECRNLAEEKADELNASGNAQGCAYWMRVISAIEQELNGTDTRTVH